MTKTNARVSGVNAAMHLEFTNEALLGGMDANVTAFIDLAADTAADLSNIPARLRLEFGDAFKNQAQLNYRARRNELPEVISQQRVDAFMWHLDYLERGAASAIEKFKKSFEEDAHYAFRWADSAMESASQARFAASIRVALADGRTIDEILQWLRNQLASVAGEVQRFDLSCSNAMGDFDRRALADFVRHFADRS